MIFLDTHVLVWLYKGDPELFSPRARQELSDGDLVVSPMVLLELQYLYEAKKIRVHGETILASLRKTIGVHVSQTDWETVIHAALTLSWTRDPFDRIIVAHAESQKVKLLTKDRCILDHSAIAVW